MAELSTLARPYAKAAFSCALANTHLTNWLQSLNELNYVVSSDKVAPSLLAPSVRPDQQVSMILSLLGENIEKSVVNFITLLTENKRLLLAPEIALQFKAMKQAHEKMCDVQVISAYENSSEEEQKLAAVLQKTLNSDVSIEASVDKNLIGGVVIRAGDLVIDNSIRGRLAKLNEAMGL